MKIDDLHRLIVQCERADVGEPMLREALSDRLFQCALEMHKRGVVSDERYLWSALRRSITLGEKNGMQRFSVFLAPTAPAKTRQVTLQALANKAAKTPYESPNEHLVSCVVPIIHALASPHSLGVPQTAALCISAVRAGVALGVGTIPEMVPGFRSFPLLGRQLDVALQTLSRRWGDEFRSHKDLCLAIRAAIQPLED